VLTGLAATVLLGACGTGIIGPAKPPCPTEAPSAGEAQQILAAVTDVTVNTTLGSFTVTLEPTWAPIAAANFAALARCGFYDGITFHRVVSGFVIQAGDPNTRDNQGDFEGLGTGGPGYGFPIELPAEGLAYDPYAVAMANTGAPNSNGSQFFIALTDIDARLPGRTYSLLGTVTAGREVVDAIGAVEVVALGVPVDPVVINDMEVAGAESTPSQP
jgi:dolichyl-diphosphooligosaccharide--protein glycosyltransferase